MRVTIITDRITDNLGSKINEYLTSCVQQNKFAGTVLIAHDGKILFKNAYGMADNERKILNKIETKFKIASVTKQFTAVAIMILQEKSLLNVHDKISKYIPNYPNGDKITIHHLLTHSSGVFNYTLLEDYPNLAKNLVSLDDILNLFKDKPLDFEIGTKFSYSNSGYVLLTSIIENISGVSYEEFLNQNIFNPIGMNNSGCYHNEKPPINDSIGYTLSETATIIKHQKPGKSIVAGDGSLYSTVEDLFIWDQALYFEKLVSKSSTEQMFRKYFYGNDRNFGYGWTIEEISGKTCIGHPGRHYGFISQISRYVNDSACIIVLSNLDVSPIEEISRKLASILFN
jgi:CubicO group peptidase (beta-lactamase class C family)